MLRERSLTVVLTSLLAVAMASLTIHRGLWHSRFLAHGWMLSLQTFMASNWLAFGVGQTLIVTSGVLPASMIAMMAGATLGFGWGLLLSAVSTFLGGWLAFALSRTTLRGSIARYLQKHSDIARLDTAMTSEGWRMVALLRISPIMPFALTSYGFGLTRISQRDYLLGTIASLPALIGYVALGALGQQGILTAGKGNSGWHLVVIVGGVGAVLYALYRVKKTLTQVIAL